MNSITHFNIIRFYQKYVIFSFYIQYYLLVQDLHVTQVNQLWQTKYQ